MKRLILGLVVLAGLLIVSPGRGGAQESLTPVERFNIASDLAAKGQVEKAIRVWLEVADELPEKFKPSVHYALGVAYSALKRYPEAWHHLNIHLELAPKPRPDAKQQLANVLAVLKESYVPVSISCDPAAGRILPAGKAGSRSFAAPLAWWFKPGKHTVRGEWEGHEPAVLVLNVSRTAQGGTYTLRFKQLEDYGKVPAGEGGALWWEWSILGGGLAAAAVGGVLHGIGYNKNEQLFDDYAHLHDQAFEDVYGPEYEEQVKPKITAAYVLYGVGGAVALAGIILVAVDQGKDASEGTQTFVVPSLSADQVGAAFGFTF